jgi:hypothetical protein
LYFWVVHHIILKHVKNLYDELFEDDEAPSEKVIAFLQK